MGKVLPEFFTRRAGREPERPLGPFQTDATVYTRPPASGLRVTWFGHSGMLVEIDGVTVLIDPVWDQRASPRQWFGPKRFFEPTLALEDLPRIDAVLISHDHYDHLSEGTVRTLARLRSTAAARWVTSLGVGAVLEGFGVRPGQIYELDWTQMVPVGNRGGSGAICEITSLPSRHFSGRSLFNRFQTLWGSFVLRSTIAGGHSVYYGADTGWWEGFAEIGAAYGPFDLTMLEIGAFHEAWAQMHLGPDGAARAFQAMGGAGLLMPVHWGLFNLALHGWREPIERMVEIAGSEGIQLWSPDPGKPTELERGVEMCSRWWHGVE
jgi:L-ascorbate metabolism protein UlaG (beta-lactamase superfamily)